MKKEVEIDTPEPKAAPRANGKQTPSTRATTVWVNIVLWSGAVSMLAVAVGLVALVVQVFTL